MNLLPKARWTIGDVGEPSPKKNGDSVLLLQGWHEDALVVEHAIT